MQKFDTTKSIFEMTDKQRNVDGWAAELDLEYITELIKNNKGLRFKREIPDDQSYVLVSPNFNDDERPYRVTYIDQYGPSGHSEHQNAELAARDVITELPYKQKNLIPKEVIN